MSSYTEGQTHQLMERLEKEGFTPDDVIKLGQFKEGMAKISPVIEDASRVTTINATTIAVNLGVIPKLPFYRAKIEQHIGEGWAIVERRDDELYVNSRKVILHLSKRQKNDKRLEGHELREELTGKPVLNANILDALYNNPHLIPEDWKGDKQGNTRYIFFWATIYRRVGGRLCVRCLCFNDGVWCWHYDWLDAGWSGGCPAALLQVSCSLSPW